MTAQQKCVARKGTHLSVSPHAEELDGNQSQEQRHDPSTVIDTLRSLPEVNNIAGGRDLERQNRQPTDSVLPGAGKTPRRIDESGNVDGEGAIDGIQDGHLSESLHHEVDTATDEGETDEHRGRTT